MLAAGALTATVTSKKSGQHVTLRMRACLKDERTGKWPRVPYEGASHVFIEDFDGERVATFYPKSGVIFYADRASVAARWTVAALLRFLAGRFPTFESVAELASADACGRCGKQLSDPVSLERGLGPECFGLATGSRAVKAIAS